MDQSSDINSPNIPDLVLVLARDGRLLSRVGGRALPEFLGDGLEAGRPLEDVWREEFSRLIKQLVRKSIASRQPLEIRHVEQGHPLQIRVAPEGPDRASCIIRAELAPKSDEDSRTTRRDQLFLDRRGFLKRFQETLSMSVLTEKPAALIVLELDGVEQIARLDRDVAEQATNLAILRLSGDLSRSGSCAELVGCLGQLRDDQLALVMQTDDREAIRRAIDTIVSSLSQSLHVGDAMFQLTPSAGVAVLGRDANSQRSLIEHARMAAGEARRDAAQNAAFFSDTVRIRALSRLDIAHELRQAIERRDIGVRYIARHDLDSGELVALVAYARWSQRLRGEISPRQFLDVAEATGSSVLLSRALLERVCIDRSRLLPQLATGLRISFGPLRQHLLHEDFVADIEHCVQSGKIDAALLEIRISERAFVGVPEKTLAHLDGLGVRLIVDEVGRGVVPLEKLARAPLFGLQLDRGWVVSLESDTVAQRLCRAGIAAAQALELATIANGVDSDEQRRRLLEFGCRQGSGDLFPRIEQEEVDVRPRVTRATR